jgi:hypothetical protein
MHGTAQPERPPLTKIVGTIASITLAEASNKPGKIELTNGKILRAFPDKLQMVREGGSYDFGCEPTEFRGVLNHTVRAVRATGGSSEVAPAPPNFLTQEEVAAQRRPQRAIDAQATLLSHGSTTQNLQGNSGHAPQPTAPKTATPQNGYYRPTAPKDSERMWTCAILGHIIDRGGVELTEEALIHAVNTLRAVYQKTYGLDDTAA